MTWEIDGKDYRIIRSTRTLGRKITEHEIYGKNKGCFTDFGMANSNLILSIHFQTQAKLNTFLNSFGTEHVLKIKENVSTVYFAYPQNLLRTVNSGPDNRLIADIQFVLVYPYRFEEIRTKNVSLGIKEGYININNSGNAPSPLSITYEVYNKSSIEGELVWEEHFNTLSIWYPIDVLEESWVPTHLPMRVYRFSDSPKGEKCSIYNDMPNCCPHYMPYPPCINNICNYSYSTDNVEYKASFHVGKINEFVMHKTLWSMNHQRVGNNYYYSRQDTLAMRIGYTPKNNPTKFVLELNASIKAENLSYVLKSDTLITDTSLPVQIYLRENSSNFVYFSEIQNDVLTKVEGAVKNEHYNTSEFLIFLGVDGRTKTYLGWWGEKWKVEEYYDNPYKKPLSLKVKEFKLTFQNEEAYPTCFVNMSYIPYAIKIRGKGSTDSAVYVQFRKGSDFNEIVSTSCIPAANWSSDHLIVLPAEYNENNFYLTFKLYGFSYNKPELEVFETNNNSDCLYYNSFSGLEKIENSEAQTFIKDAYLSRIEATESHFQLLTDSMSFLNHSGKIQGKYYYDQFDNNKYEFNIEKSPVFNYFYKSNVSNTPWRTNINSSDSWIMFLIRLPAPIKLHPTIQCLNGGSPLAKIVFPGDDYINSEVNMILPNSSLYFYLDRKTKVIGKSEFILSINASENTSFVINELNLKIDMLDFPLNKMWLQPGQNVLKYSFINFPGTANISFSWRNSYVI